MPPKGPGMGRPSGGSGRETGNPRQRIDSDKKADIREALQSHSLTQGSRPTAQAGRPTTQSGRPTVQSHSESSRPTLHEKPTQSAKPTQQSGGLFGQNVKPTQQSGGLFGQNVKPTQQTGGLFGGHGQLPPQGHMPTQSQGGLFGQGSMYGQQTQQYGHMHDDHVHSHDHHHDHMHDAHGHSHDYHHDHMHDHDHMPGHSQGGGLFGSVPGGYTTSRPNTQTIYTQPHQQSGSILGAVIQAAAAGMAMAKAKEAMEEAAERERQRQEQLQAEAEAQAYVPVEDLQDNTVKEDEKDYSDEEGYPAFCPGCGAPTIGKRYCEYCGIKVF